MPIPGRAGSTTAMPRETAAAIIWGHNASISTGPRAEDCCSIRITGVGPAGSTGTRSSTAAMNADCGSVTPLPRVIGITSTLAAGAIPMQSVVGRVLWYRSDDAQHARAMVNVSLALAISDGHSGQVAMGEVPVLFDIYQPHAFAVTFFLVP